MYYGNHIQIKLRGNNCDEEVILINKDMQSWRVRSKVQCHAEG